MIVLFVVLLVHGVCGARPTGCNNAYKQSCGGCLVERSNSAVGAAEFVLVNSGNPSRSCDAYRQATEHWCDGGVSAQATNDCRNLAADTGCNCASVVRSRTAAFVRLLFFNSRV